MAPTLLEPIESLENFMIFLVVRRHKVTFPVSVT